MQFVILSITISPPLGVGITYAGVSAELSSPRKNSQANTKPPFKKRRRGVGMRGWFGKAQNHILQNQKPTAQKPTPRQRHKNLCPMSQFRFTLRQREFAPAAKAAHAAGYAKSTAETNAAQLLDHPYVQAHILKLRGTRLIRREEAERMKAAALHILDYTTDDKMRMAAMRRLEALDKMRIHPLDDDYFRNQILIDTEEQKNQAEQALEEQQAAQTQVTSETENEVSSLQPIENEHTLFLQRLTRIPETDTLPDGSTALDTQISPRKPTPPPPPKHIIEIRNLLPEE